MVTKNELKYIRRLNNKSERIKNNQFVVEGEKSIKDFLSSDYKLKKLFSTHPEDFNLFDKTVNISLSQLKQISFLKSPNKHLGVFEIKNKELKKNSQYILLDSINDPGNLGTIIRSAEWFGFKQIICSKNSVDCYNPKVVQSSMGSLSRVDIIYTDLIKFIRNEKIPVFGTSKEGKSILEFSKNINSGIWIFGSEANGISNDISELCESFYSIPKLNKEILTESLNLSTSASLVMGYLKLFNRSLDL
ncbi:MAG: TrmH family RNA methyltransferase [Flavobacteriaceae bacterium]